jgi:hypothetical protein
MNHVLKLTGQIARAAAIRRIREAPDGYVVTIKAPTRTLDQNALLHAVLSDISKQAKYLGSYRSVEFWKGLFVSGWEIATGRKPLIVPGLEGEFINIRESTTTLSQKKLSELVEYIEAWCAMNDVVLRDVHHGQWRKAS